MKKFFIAFGLMFLVFFLFFMAFALLNDVTIKLIDPYRAMVPAAIAALLTPRIQIINAQSGKKIQVTSLIFKRLNFIY